MAAATWQLQAWRYGRQLAEQANLHAQERQQKAEATTRAQLDPAHARRIVAITDAGDQGLIALRACQAYVRALQR
ncbi:hypothetical protein [Pseudomonas alkylphenolica]|uniref:hypothetical protein n=1 Tax=Pseudomonas alkylphenolica TaxID=237609 RepID=UPI0018D67A9D|nr:hypothetical protein [Pseudomonas alkylphenolica]MBH3429402.1 hypothetical protein [Pseudomonas alkylphenolica]